MNCTYRYYEQKLTSWHRFKGYADYYLRKIKFIVQNVVNVLLRGY